jgi:hypothetical protein
MWAVIKMDFNSLKQTYMFVLGAILIGIVLKLCTNFYPFYGQFAKFLPFAVLSSFIGLFDAERKNNLNRTIYALPTIRKKIVLISFIELVFIVLVVSFFVASEELKTISSPEFIQYMLKLSSVLNILGVVSITSYYIANKAFDIKYALLGLVLIFIVGRFVPYFPKINNLHLILPIVAIATIITGIKLSQKYVVKHTY